MTDTNAIIGRVRCGNAFHRVVMHDDGKFETPDCPDAVAKSQSVASMIKLGDQSFRNRSGCMPLVALCAGLPALVAAGRVKTDDLGGWLDLYMRYETHKLVRTTIRHANEARLAPHIGTIRSARKAMSKAYYWNYFQDPEEREMHLIEEVTFLCGVEPTVGQVVASDIDGAWSVPLQADWLRNVGECKPVIGGRFVVGVNRKHAGFVYAIDGDSEDGYVVSEFALVNGKLGRIKS